MTSFTNFLINALPYLLAGGVLSPIAALINKLIKAQSAITKFLVVFGGAIVGVIVHAFLTTQTNDVNILAAQSAIVTFLSTPFYLLLVKPLMQWLEGQFAKAAAFDAQVKSAAELPAGPTA